MIIWMPLDMPQINSTFCVFFENEKLKRYRIGTISQKIHGHATFVLRVSLHLQSAIQRFSTAFWMWIFQSYKETLKFFDFN